MEAQRVEYYRNLARLAREVPKGYIYVGKGRTGGLEFGPWLRGLNVLSGLSLVGDDPNEDYACPKDVWERTVRPGPKNLNEIRNEFAEAKELVGKRVTIGGKTKLEFGKTHLVEKVDFYLEDPKGLSSIEEAIENDGYCLALSGEGCDTAFGYHKLADEIQLNSKYTARITDEGVKVGCQTFEFKKVLELAEAVKKFQS